MKISLTGKHVKIAVALIIAVVVLIYISTQLLSSYSRTYNIWIDHREFSSMCNYINTHKVERVELHVQNSDGQFDVPISADSIGVLKGLSYVRTGWNYTTYLIPKNIVGFEIYFEHGICLDFCTDNDVDFSVSFNDNNRYFYVKAPDLTDYIQSDAFKQLQLQSKWGAAKK